jgi:hypothetical protein
MPFGNIIRNCIISANSFVTPSSIAIAFLCCYSLGVSSAFISVTISVRAREQGCIVVGGARKKSESLPVVDFEGAWD